eukprot:CAMPEP_0119104538 /NCGR_PEP_ID=MMETSP1180-20130426/2731_1 /TAXON_ID=3052 ORGANISM="Chlamydomonas cf sp, Strain CCMP681" /NCGR_SAMPLE_ID=MMETSP1180 /ASSEMBLY_ACC=CAM_ASM_000741 /LENGTH=55 /DNA_ID=CAMNT_0007089333 /DNA_START=919 /DNA_END=1086 /DNA_ORIENTATION=+
MTPVALEGMSIGSGSSKREGRPDPCTVTSVLSWALVGALADLREALERRCSRTAT